jgi:chemotaxis protein MotB
VNFGAGAITFAAGYIRADIPTAGTVTRTSDDRQLVGKGDTLYLRMTNPADVALGAKYTIYRRVHRVFHPLSRRYLGDLISILGILRITAIDQNIATARIERSYTSVAPGDAVMPYEPPSKTDSAGPHTLPESPGAIVDMQVQRTLIGQTNLVYLDWGRDDGLRIGDILDVYRVRPNVPPRVIGEVRILSVEDRTATALIQRSTLPFLLGDRVLGRETVKDIAHELEMPVRHAEPGIKPPPATPPAEPRAAEPEPPAEPAAIEPAPAPTEATR